MKKQAAAVFTKVSEWVAAGNMKTGLYSLERVERETEKAIGFKAEKYTEFGNLKPAICWIPKSKLQAVVNDFYTSGPTKMFLVPAWLYNIKTEEGFVL
ncbi:hypothetical protein IST455A_03650 [Burkholderia multivorans]|uniref:hypothetical protein n=1 Tax=Burkholderia multivorans TaxID=87883 RepID=UPI0015E35AC4|nr:hypothetical protein [Burkholderia multivorans]MCL4660605.1 hypothetical protein [Burkholderia multivorans]MCO1352039.1 hypothetical protein [Burkholderia multivorans]MCO1414117.1 hypothetical protein [Burkholderia multivorans]MCO1445696.1 hypothetical protein [Burkholderia multivorans]UQP46132.1 hypothetical protein L0Z16_15285 [Burkholderia multivorans]